MRGLKTLVEEAQLLEGQPRFTHAQVNYQEK